MLIHVSRYSENDANLWNDFVAHAKNGTFLFNRNYMDYHRSRFNDHSLLIYQDDSLIALFPANLKDNILYSHQGLTYGGVIVDKQMRAPLMLDVFEHIKKYANEIGITSIHYKAIPHIYHRYPAEEDLYALFRMNAQIVRTDVSTAILLNNRWPLHQSKKSGLNKAKKSGIKIEASTNFELFFSMVEHRLAERYSATPVHTAKEMSLLAARFPENIKLFAASLDHEIVAGVIVYITHNVIHTQYIASTAKGRELRAVDYIIAHLIDTLPQKHVYFDFGISNENQGQVLNAGLASQKEEFGGRSTVHQTYVWPVALP